MDRFDRFLSSREFVTPFVGAGATIHALPSEPCARWSGLLADGVERCDRRLTNLPENWRDLRLAMLQRADVPALLAVADEITRRLQDAAEWDAWIASAVGRLTVARPTALHTALCQMNDLVLTTNYDLLLEQAAPDRLSLANDESGPLTRAIADRERAIIHLHGIVGRPSSIVLGSASYQHLIDDSFAQIMQQTVLTSRRLLFVGCGNGLDDPNIGPALEVLRSLRAGLADGVEHFVLVRGPELGQALTAQQPANATPIAFGKDWPELPTFLEKLVRGEALDVSQEPRDWLSLSPTRPQNALLDLAGPAEDHLTNAIAAATRALRAIGQLEHRWATPLGIDDWPYPDQLIVHQQLAASAHGAAKRVADNTFALLDAIGAAGRYVGMLTQTNSERLRPLDNSLAQLTGHCREISERLTMLSSEMSRRLRLCDDYRDAADAMREAETWTQDVVAEADSLRSDRVR